MTATNRWWVLAVVMAVACGCGGRQKEHKSLETRPLEEVRGLEIAVEAVKARGYSTTSDVEVELSNKVRFKADLRVSGERIAIEYLTEQDRLEIGVIPPPAPGSRLHVLAARTVPPDPAIQGENVYVFFLDDRRFEYQFNPTSDNRANVTYQEVESRLKRDMADFLSWYETSQKTKAR